MGARSAGLLIVFIGLALVLVGLLAMTGAFNWFGRLPGDMRIGDGRTRLYVPLASMLLVSLLLSLLLYVLRRFF